jgi:hypothetical protein
VNHSGSSIPENVIVPPLVPTILPVLTNKPHTGGRCFGIWVST